MPNIFAHSFGKKILFGVMAILQLALATLQKKRLKVILKIKGKIKTPLKGHCFLMKHMKDTITFILAVSKILCNMDFERKLKNEQNED